MDFTFLHPSGEVAFFRSDAEQAEWTQEELSLLCTFPFDNGKNIERGMIVLFQDPATDNWQAYEIRNCATYPDETYQQFTAEDLAISELTDCHIEEETEFTNVSAKSALTDLLSGTGWNVGEDESKGSSSGDVSRGSVWQGISTISKNWNVYIVPRVTVNASGIVKRYLDIYKPTGVWRGLRLSVNKDLSDPCLTYDDTELKTALYGYGATYNDDDGESQEYNFADVVWTKENGHPAKPAGQKYIEDPSKTAKYGRNGKPRFGYYQSTEIEDGETLLEKTWETLETVSEPKISITGTVLDLRRMGYADQPIRLHDLAIVELEPVGDLFYKQITTCTVDLINPDKTSVNIGNYIPNIIYISRDTEEDSTGGSGSGGSTNNEKKQGEFETSIEWNERNILLNAKHIDEHGNILQQAGMYIDPITGVLVYAEDTENNIGSKFRVQSDRITSEVGRLDGEIEGLGSRITQTQNAITLEVQNRVSADNALSGRITVEAGRITQEVTDRTNADTTLSGRITVEANRITAEVTRATTAEGTLSGRITVNADNITAEVTRATTAEGTLSGRITVNADNITAEVTRATTAEGTLSGRITVNADNISAEVTRATTAEGTLSGRIDVQADRIDLVVTGSGSGAEVNAASIVLGINGQSGSYVKIRAGTIDLDGYVTVSSLNAVDAKIDNLTSGYAQATELNAVNLKCNNFYLGGTRIYSSYRVQTTSGTFIYALGYATS